MVVSAVRSILISYEYYLKLKEYKSQHHFKLKYIEFIYKITCKDLQSMLIQ